MIIKDGSGQARLSEDGVCLIQIYVVCLLHIYVVAGLGRRDILSRRLPNIMIGKGARSMHAGAAEIASRNRMRCP